MRLTLPADSTERKDIPIRSGCIDYFPAAIAGVAKHSVVSNSKHNPGQPMHHARGKSMDHADCIDRHLTDLHDMLASYSRNQWGDGNIVLAILAEANALCWRALALSQELHERFGAPLAPAARLPENKDPTPDVTALSDDELIRATRTLKPGRIHATRCGLDTDHEGSCA